MTIHQLLNDLPASIDWLSHNQTASFLGIHQSQYRRDLTLLNAIGLISRNRFSKGCNRETIEILARFRNLAKERGREEAARQLIKDKEKNP